MLFWGIVLLLINALVAWLGSKIGVGFGGSYDFWENFIVLPIVLTVLLAIVGLDTLMKNNK